MARTRRNPEGRYFDGGRGQMECFTYVEIHEGAGGKEAYRLPDDTWLSGVRQYHGSVPGNLTKRRKTKRPPKWVKIPSNPGRRLPNDPASVTRSHYPSVFDDTDDDQIPDVDDPHPFTPGDTESIEEVRLSDEIGAFIDAREAYVPAMRDTMRRLERIGIKGSEVSGRVKTPYSVVNKLRRRALGTLTDIAGTRILVPDQASVEAVTAAVEGEFEIVEKEDFYVEPKAGYRAIHYIVRVNGLPVELQVKTHRMGEIAEASHTPYKRGDLNAEAMEYLTSLAALADPPSDEGWPTVAEIDDLGGHVEPSVLSQGRRFEDGLRALEQLFQLCDLGDDVWVGDGLRYAQRALFEPLVSLSTRHAHTLPKAAA